MILPQNVTNAFKKHVLDSYPYEACGVVCGAVYVPCRNSADDPLRDFAIKAEEMARAELQHGRTTAILHSHPYHPQQAPAHPAEWPSELDQANYLKGRTPWGIVATDGEGISEILWMDPSYRAPYEGRQFQWFVADCFTLARDWLFNERGIEVQNFPRKWLHWEDGRSMYDELFAAAGFDEVNPEEVQAGDCVLMRLRGNLSSHAGVITGPDTLLHHHYHRLSGYDSLHKWRRQVTKYLRYVGDKK